MDELVEIPWDALEQETLYRLVEEFVTRDGTDYGAEEIQLERKVLQVVQGIKRGLYVIVFQQEQGAANIITKEQWHKINKEIDDSFQL